MGIDKVGYRKTKEHDTANVVTSIKSSQHYANIETIATHKKIPHKKIKIMAEICDIIIAITTNKSSQHYANIETIADHQKTQESKSWFSNFLSSSSSTFVIISR